MRNLRRFLFFAFVFFLTLSGLLLSGFLSDKQITLENLSGRLVFQSSMVSGFIALCLYVARKTLKEKIDKKEKEKDELINSINQD